MAEKIDIEELKSRISMVDLAAACGVDLKKQGNEYKGLCPFHSERTPSFTVTPAKGEAYYCFGCGDGGDHVQFIQNLYSADFPAALEKLQEIVGTGSTTGDKRKPRKSTKPPKPEDSWQPMGAGPEIDPPATLSVNRDGKWLDVPVVDKWAYRGTDGALHGFTCRVEPEPGKKEIIPLTWMVNTETGATDLRRKSLPEPRLLYGAELLSMHPESNVILVEGEKAADALRRMVPVKTGLVMTWPGGGKAVKKADWSMLAGRKIIGWPDCDSKRDKKTGEYIPHHEQPGTSAMIEVADYVRRHGASMSIIRVPEPGELADGWDAADAESEGWARSDVVQFIKDRKTSPESIAPSNEAAREDPKPTTNPDPVPPATQSWVDQTVDLAGQPFKCLGVDEGVYYYLPFSTQQVTSISAAGHSNKSNLLQLASYDFWEGQMSGRSGPDWTKIASYLLERNAHIGVFDPDKIRGRGVWFDDGRCVLHLGNRLIVDDKEMTIQDLDTRFIYERKPALEAMKPKGELTDDEAMMLHAIAGMPNWQKPINATLFAGWVALAPICGAMLWRPHVWVTGQRGTGKSWLMTNVAAPVLGASALVVASSTSEAGIRQRLKQDARPVIFDEAEGETKHDRERVQKVLELARQASSDSLAEIAKGSPSGSAQVFRARTMFMMGSINVGLALASDKSRFTILSLQKGKFGAEGRRQFEALEDMVNNTLTNDYCAALRSRIYRLIPVIRKNTKLFGKAAAEHIGNQRAGDQLGALLAGAWALQSQEVISYEEANEFVKGQDWGFEQDESIDSDETTVMNEVLSAKVEIEIQGGMRRNRTVAEILQMVSGRINDMEYTRDDGNQALARIGVRLKEGFVLISESHPKLRGILKDTPWGGGWADVISRIGGAERISVCRFAGMRTRAVKVPESQIFE